MGPDRTRSGGRPARALLAAAVLAVLMLPFGAATASAHAVLVSADPGQGRQVATAPGAVTLRFSEPVNLTARTLVVQDGQGRRVDDGDARALPDGLGVTVRLRAGLGQGSYAVLWQVVSADGHPIGGSYSFGVGVPAGAAPEQGEPDDGVVLARWLAQLVSYAGVVLLLGGGLFAVVLWPRTLGTARLRRLVLTGAGLTAGGAAALFLLQGPYGAGAGLGGVLDPELLGTSFGSTTGRLLLLRVLAVVIAVPLLAPRAGAPGPLAAGAAKDAGDDARDHARGGAQDHARDHAEDDVAAGEVAAQAEPADRFSAVLVAAVVLVTFALTGHAGQGRPAWLSISADALHLAAACAWLGGLVVLASAFLPSADDRDRRAVLPRWSRLAMGSVAVLVVTGTYQAWREVGSVAALLGTEYGRLVLGKVAGIVVLLTLGELGRRWVRRHVAAPRPAPTRAGRLRRVATPSEAGGPAAGPAGAVATAVSDPSDRADPAGPGGHDGAEGSAPVLRLRESVLAEVGIGVAVLALTAALVSTVPARQDYAPPFSGTAVARSAEGDTVRVSVEVGSPRVGAQTIRVRTTSDDGRPLPVSSVQGALLERDTGVGPVRAAFTGDAATGLLAAEQVVVPTPGAWTLTLQVSTDPLTTYTAALTYDVR